MERIGRYRIIGELGRGAMGVVYHAIDPSIGRSVAIKTIRIQDIDDTQQRDKLRTRLFREARSAGVLSHPNIVTIYDMDEADGLAYIAMAFVNGPTLEKILSSEKPLSGAVMLRILRQTAAGLDYAHTKGIVHRDVKPANIMTDEDGEVKITDFGIAKFTAPERNTETRTITGTPNYMSPEQVQGQGIDGRSDQFSLAVIAYEILTGERPFVGEALGTVVYKIVAEEPAPAHRLNGTLTEQIDGVLRKALSKKIEGRYATCSEFVKALDWACSESRGWKTVLANTAALQPTAAVPREVLQTADVPLRTPAAARQKSPSLLVPALMSLTVVGGIAGIAAYQSGWQPFAEAASRQDVTAAPGPSAQQEPKVQRPSPLPPGDVDPNALPEPAPGQTKPAETQAGETKPVETRPAESNSAESKTAGTPLAAPVVIDQAPAPVVMRATLEKEAPAFRAARAEDVWVTSNPGGAKAVLDDNFAQSCQTPCTLKAPNGRHRVMISMGGYISETRDFTVAGSALDVPPVTLRQPNGSVWVSSNPKGASLRVDGKVWPEKTPATVSLQPGDHTVVVEHDGQSITKRFDIAAGSTRTWNIIF